ncbi:MAG: UDP-N-acetylmuramate--L-alanine ligase [Bdellovibrionales bacterium]|nr:UDP-N-acetylmuramate--L-alanine ligase [Bdellovibrionales bacterium]
MSGLAELLHNMGAHVTGSDSQENIQTQRLRDLGISIYLGQKPQNLSQAEVVVYSSAVKADNPEYQEAFRKKIPLIRRAEALAEIMRLKRGIGIAGTHGKTTTTSLTASIFLGSHFDPTIVVGGRLDIIKSTALLGQGEWIIAEADESDGSFTRLSPEIVVITNVDNDHLDHYGSMGALRRAFYDFALRIPFYGTAIICGDDLEVRRLFHDFPKKKIFYGFSPENDVVVSGSNNNYLIKFSENYCCELKLPLPGKHNVLNATASLLVAQEAGIPLDLGLKAVGEFKGVDRRFQHKASIRGIDFFDDYGHHPTEVAAVISGCREKYPQRRQIVLFQPHRYSRTKICWESFLDCFYGADKVFLLDIYPAGEKPMLEISSKLLSQAVRHTDCQYLSRDHDEYLSILQKELRPGDILITLGAGDVYKLGEKLMDLLNK